jgi:hypothetical protein
MGQAAGLILGAAGAVVGSFFGAPEIGFMAGSILGAILFPPKGPNPPDLRVQDSAYGKWIPMVWGRYRTSGNVIWMGTPHAHGTGGKGMGGKTQGPYTTLSFAVALCEGPITAVTRIWANGQLIYDVSNPSDWQALSGSSSMVTNFTVYTGSETQLPDPTMESYQGDMTPAYRGIAYVVFNELSLQQWGNFMPSLTFEVQGAGAAPIQATPTLSATNVPNNYATGITSVQNGVAKGWVWLSFGGAAQPFTLTPYGTTYGPVFAVDDEWSSAWGGSVRDQDGLGRTMDGSGGFLDPVLGKIGSINNWQGFGSNGSALITSNTVYFTYNQGGAGGSSAFAPWLPVLLEVPTAAPYPVGIQSFLGTTDKYLYCIDWNLNFVQLDLDMNLVTNYGAVPFPGNILASLPGVVFGDTDIQVFSGGEVWQWNGSAWANTGKPAPTEGSVAAFMAGNAVTGDGIGTTMYMASQTAFASSSLATIIADVLEQAGLQPSQFDVSQCTDTVIGFASTNNSSPRDILKPLLAAYFIDASDSDGMLKFIHRGATPTTTIPWDDLGADAKENSDQARNPISETVAQEYDLPCQETLSYLSASTDYQTLSQRAFMGTTTSNLYESTNFPGVLADNDAMVRVQAMLWERWSKRRAFKFSAGYKWIALEPGDTINLQQQNGQLIPVRITQVQFDGKGCLSYDADFTVPSIYPVPGTSTYTAQASNAQGVPNQTLPYSGPTQLVVMDVPPLRAQDATTPGLYLAADGFASDWPGCLVDLSRDDVNFSELLSATSAAVIGTAGTVLGNFSGGNIPDELNAVTINLIDPSQSLASVSFASFLNGANAAYLGGELIYFRNAEQISSTQWVLSGLLRGRVGTEAAIKTHSIGEPFVLLSSSALYEASINLTDIGQNLYFEAYLANLFGTTPSAPVGVTPKNARLAPLAPFQLQASKGSAASLQDWTLKWFRRARINYGWTDGADVPLDWQQESYSVTIYNSGGQQINRYTIAAAGLEWNGGSTPQSTPANPSSQSLPPFAWPTQPYFTYTAAMISNDGFTPGSSITAVVQQIGDYGVPGLTASMTFTR